MKIIKHGELIVFTCKKCGCIFSEIPKLCRSSLGEHGANYMMSCPECSSTCLANDDCTMSKYMEGNK